MASGKHGNNLKKNGANLGFKATIWAAADKLHNNMNAAEYKHVILDLIFLKYIPDAFEEKHGQLLQGYQRASSGCPMRLASPIYSFRRINKWLMI